MKPKILEIKSLIKLIKSKQTPIKADEMDSNSIVKFRKYVMENNKALKKKFLTRSTLEKKKKLRPVRPAGLKKKKRFKIHIKNYKKIFLPKISYETKAQEKESISNLLRLFISKLRRYRKGGALPLLQECFFLLQAQYKKKGTDVMTKAIKVIRPYYGLRIFSLKRRKFLVPTLVTAKKGQFYAVTWIITAIEKMKGTIPERLARVFIEILDPK